MPPPLALSAGLAAYTNPVPCATQPLPFASAPAPSVAASASASDGSPSHSQPRPVLAAIANTRHDAWLLQDADDPPLSWTDVVVAAALPITAADVPVPRRTSSPLSVPFTSITGLFLAPTVSPAVLSSLSPASYTPAPLVRRGGDGEEVEDCGCEQTTTKVVTVTASSDVPDLITVTQTYGVTKTSGTTTETIYYGTATITPSYTTVTVYPTTTEQDTKTTTVHTTTTTNTSPTATSAKTGVHRPCLPGDADEKEFTGLKPTHDQSITLYVIAIYIVGIALGWNLIGLRVLLYPFKKLTVAIHETGHILGCMALSTGIGEYSISPIAGGIVYTKLDDASSRELMPPAALPLGFVFSIVVGGLLTFAGFDTLASKIASFILGLFWLALILASGFSLDGLLCLCAAGLMVGLWWADHAWGLRWLVLFVGVMNSFYVVWDAADDAFFAKLNPCCSVLHFVTLEVWSPALWTLFYFGISFLCFIGFILAALATWKESPHAMYCQAQTFLPT